MKERRKLSGSKDGGGYDDSGWRKNLTKNSLNTPSSKNHKNCSNILGKQKSSAEEVNSYRNQ